MRMAAETLTGALERILDGECDESAIAQAIATLNANSMGKFSDDDLVTYDKAMRILGIRDRGKLKQILDENGVHQVLMHNQKVGFPRHKVLEIRNQLKNRK